MNSQHATIRQPRSPSPSPAPRAESPLIDFGGAFDALSEEGAEMQAERLFDEDMAPIVARYVTFPLHTQP